MLHISFHLYGFILGCAAVTGMYLSEKKAESHQLSKEFFWQLMTLGLFGGVIGARLWHVMTDFSLYRENVIAIFYIWNGGLSIIGAVVGAVVTIAGYVLIYKKLSAQQLYRFLDVCIFGLPLGQAIGRLGNLANHELYGLPTQLPWGIFIPLEYRKIGFESFSYFHPLFAYEAILLVIFAVVIWWLDHSQKEKLQIGSGKLTLIYILYYSIVRFLLDFLRIDKATIVGNMLGFNQVVLIFVVIMCSFFLYKNMNVKKS